MNILSIGTFDGLSNTCLHRNWALKRIADNLDEINTSRKKGIQFWYRFRHHLFLWGFPVSIPEANDENNKIIRQIRKTHYDVIWVDKGVTIYPSTLKYIKTSSPKTIIIHYSPDNMAKRHNQSYQYLKSMPCYDYEITTKSYIIDDLLKLGSRSVKFIHQSYEDTFHYPRMIGDDDLKRIGCDVGFVGAWEEERCESILYLANHGVHVKVYGNGRWLEYKDKYECLDIHGHGLFNEDYAKSFQTFKICLCFLRKMNEDQQTSRTMEIPACGGFMMAERTEEHCQLFKENKEAVFFSNNAELLEKCQYYLSHDEDRKKIALAGTERCKMSGYSNYETLKSLLNSILYEQ